MPLSLIEKLGMQMRGTPVQLISRNLARLEASGLSVPLNGLEAHVLVKGNLDRVVEAYILAHKSGAPANWTHVCAVDLKGLDPVAQVQASLIEQELIFDQYSPARPEVITGHTKDHVFVRAKCRVLYRPPIVPNPEVILRLQERLAVRIALEINTADNLSTLKRRLPEAETYLLSLARDILPSTGSVQIAYLKPEAPAGA